MTLAFVPIKSGVIATIVTSYAAALWSATVEALSLCRKLDYARKRRRDEN